MPACWNRSVATIGPAMRPAARDGRVEAEDRPLVAVAGGERDERRGRGEDEAGGDGQRREAHQQDPELVGEADHEEPGGGPGEPADHHPRLAPALDHAAHQVSLRERAITPM